MINQWGEASKLRHDLKEVKEFMHPSDVVIVGFFDNLDDPMLRLYMDAGESSCDYIQIGRMPKSLCELDRLVHRCLEWLQYIYTVNTSAVEILKSFVGPSFFIKPIV